MLKFAAMLTLFALVVLAADPAPLQVAAPGLTAAQVSPEMVSVLTDQLTTQLSLNGLRVVSAAEIATLLGVERQKQLLGCSDSGCAVELGQALGAEGVLVGSLGRFGENYQLNVKILSAKDASTLALFSGDAPREGELPKLVARAAQALAAQALKATSRPAPVAQAPTGPAVKQPANWKTRPTATRWAGTWTMVGGGAVLVAGIALAVAFPLDSDGNATGGALVLVGGGALVTGLILYLVGGTEEVPVVVDVGVGPGGFTALLRGRF